MKNTCQCLSLSVSRVDNSGNVGKSDQVLFTPFLYSKVLDVHMASSRRRSIVIDNVDGSLVVDMKDSGFQFFVAKVREDHADAENHLGGKDDGEEFGFRTGGGNSRLQFALVRNCARSKVNKESSN